jgi:hypothetical protein
MQVTCTARLGKLTADSEFRRSHKNTVTSKLESLCSEQRRGAVKN